MCCAIIITKYISIIFFSTSIHFLLANYESSRFLYIGIAIYDLVAILTTGFCIYSRGVPSSDEYTQLEF